MASASASSLSLFRSLTLALGFAVLLAAAPGAIVVPAAAAPDAATASARVAQDPSDLPVPDDPTEEPWTDEEDEEDSSDADTLAPALPDKPSTIIPDSLRFGRGVTLPAGGAAAETLGYKPAGVGMGAPFKPVAMKPKERRTLFGIHPAAFFVLLAAGHIFIVRAVTD